MMFQICQHLPPYSLPSYLLGNPPIVEMCRLGVYAIPNNSPQPDPLRTHPPPPLYPRPQEAQSSPFHLIAKRDNIAEENIDAS